MRLLLAAVLIVRRLVRGLLVGRLIRRLVRGLLVGRLIRRLVRGLLVGRLVRRLVRGLLVGRLVRRLVRGLLVAGLVHGIFVVHCIHLPCAFSIRKENENYSKKFELISVWTAVGISEDFTFLYRIICEIYLLCSMIQYIRSDISADYPIAFSIPLWYDKCKA